MKINVVFVKPELVRDSLLVVPVVEEAAKERCSYTKSLNTAIESKDFKAELNQVLIIYPEQNYSAKRVMYIGLGKEAEIDKEKLRRAYAAVEKTRIICENVHFVRNLVNENSKDKSAVILEGMAKSIARTRRIRVNVLTEREMKRLGMN